MRRRTTSIFLAAFGLIVAGMLVSCQPARSPSPSGLAASQMPTCQIARVIDGDTVAMSCAGSGPFRARLVGYDTPEAFEPACAAEAQAARAAKTRLSTLVASAQTVDAQVSGTDRYGRRLVRLAIDGRDVGDVLIAEGLAVPYGGGRRIDWCARLG